DDLAGARGDAAGEERGDVQLLPGLQVRPYRDGDLGVETYGHGPSVAPAAAPRLERWSAIIGTCPGTTGPGTGAPRARRSRPCTRTSPRTSIPGTVTRATRSA